MPMEFDKLLVTGVERGASDLHLKANAPVILRIHGRLVPQGDLGVLTAEDMDAIAHRCLTERMYAQLMDGREVDYINRTRNDHIITIEDPIEFTHDDIGCVVSQREIGHDSPSFATALRAALREDPDVILVGEMRDPETMSVALHAAETGHLVFSTLHTLNAGETVNRIIG